MCPVQTGTRDAEMKGLIPPSKELVVLQKVKVKLLSRLTLRPHGL